MTRPKQDYTYARVSSTSQDTLGQRPLLASWRAENSPDAIHLEDIGTGKTYDRVGLNQIVQAIAANAVRRVVVVSINRLGRNVTEAVKFLDLAAANKVTIVSMREGSLDLASPIGKCIAAVLLSFAQLDNELRSEATKAGIAAKKQLAEQNGRKFQFGGSSKGWSHAVTEAKQEIILHLKDKGYSYRTIAAEVGLSDKTVRTVCLAPRAKIVTRKELAEQG